MLLLKDIDDSSEVECVASGVDSVEVNDVSGVRWNVHVGEKLVICKADRSSRGEGSVTLNCGYWAVSRMDVALNSRSERQFDLYEACTRTWAIDQIHVNSGDYTSLSNQLVNQIACVSRSSIIIVVRFSYHITIKGTGYYQ